MTSITIRFAHNDDNWRITCQASSGQCCFWRNGSFVRSTTYVPRQGLTDADGLAPEVMPKLLDCLNSHARRIEDVQRLSLR